MEEKNNNHTETPVNREEEVAKLKKQRLRQRIVSAFGVAIMLWGVV